ncbi:MAG: tRNA pseudouridine(55) synthase TruB [Chloroflexota bacterium]|nr:tRNA pseudouridine(55) synthase TruB [Chloroflexota bacterium]
MTEAVPAPVGVLVLDKPLGLTSFDVVARVRRICGLKTVGHAGTLDPLATGVLPVCLGAATRLIEFLADASKAYRATVRLGATSATYDGEGPITPTVTDLALLPDQVTLEAALAAFRGAQRQLPPMHSAVQQGGKRLYELARAGLEVERTPRPITIYTLDLLAYQPPDLTLQIECSKGTYIRSLAHDLGAALGCGAYLAGLIRTRHGPFTLAEAISLDDLATAQAAGRLGDVLRPPDLLVQSWPRLDLDATAARHLAQGKPVAHPPPAEGAALRLRAYGPDGRFLAVVYWDAAKAIWHPAKVFL